MKYFSVKAKCGHVGRGHYYEGEFFVQAENAPDAAKIVRFMPRVKHHHKDAILDGTEKLTFIEGEFFNYNYFFTFSRKEGRRLEFRKKKGVLSPC